MTKEYAHIENIKFIISDYFGVSIADLEGKKRKRELVIPRHICIAFCKYATSLSLKTIGEEFNRDHSTVIHALVKVSDIITSKGPFDRSIKEQITELEARIGYKIEEYVSKEPLPPKVPKYRKAKRTCRVKKVKFVTPKKI